MLAATGILQLDLTHPLKFQIAMFQVWTASWKVPVHLIQQAEQTHVPVSSTHVTNGLSASLDRPATITSQPWQKPSSVPYFFKDAAAGAKNIALVSFVLPASSSQAYFVMLTGVVEKPEKAGRVENGCSDMWCSSRR